MFPIVFFYLAVSHIWTMESLQLRLSTTWVGASPCVQLITSKCAVTDTFQASTLLVISYFWTTSTMTDIYLSSWTTRLSFYASFMIGQYMSLISKETHQPIAARHEEVITSSKIQAGSGYGTKVDPHNNSRALLWQHNDSTIPSYFCIACHLVTFDYTMV